MKKNLVTIALLLFATGSFAQYRHNRNSTPQTVQESFKRDHPDQTNAHWTQTNGQWHTTYNNQNRNVDEYYDRKGNRMYSRTKWDRKDLPSDYDNRIRSKYHTTNYRVTKIERPSQPSLFELLLNIGGRNKTVYTDESGSEVRYRPGY